MSSTIPPVLVQLVADVTQLKAGLVQAQNSLKNLDDTVQQSGNAMNGFMNKIKGVGGALGIAFGGAAVLNFLRSSVTEANAASAAQERLRQLLITTGGATNEYVDHLLEQAAALEKVGVVSKSNIVVAQSQLATFDLTGDTIKTLTPAILDYVTAEKGAAATSDDFRQMTNGLAQALNGNFGSLTRVGFVLDDQTKKLISNGTESQRAAAIVDVLNSTYKDFNASLRDTNPMQVVMNELGNLKEDLGAALLPALEKVSTFVSDTFIPALRKFGKFIADNKEVILTLVTVLTAAYVALKIYNGILIVVKVTQQLYAVATVLMKGAQLASIASTNGLAASMLALNAAMRANPIGIIVTALALVAAGFVYAWNNSETFRKMVITVAKSVIVQVALVIRIFGELAEVILKVVSGPMRLLLKGLALLKVPGAQTALDGINNAIGKVGEFAETTSKKVLGLIATADKLGNKKIKLPGFLTGETKTGTGSTGGGGGGGGGGTGTGLTDEQKKKLKEYKKDVLDIYKDMNEAILDAKENSAKELEQRDERIASAKLRYDDIMAEAQQDRERAEASARKRNTEVLLQIDNEYAKKKIDLEKNRDKQLANLQEAATKKRNELTKSASEKERSIIQTSIDRLRDAFASKLSFNLADSFDLTAFTSSLSIKTAAGWTTAFSTAAKKGTDKLLADLKEKLQGAKDLQANAAKLAGMGYSQTFIEEVVKNGPEAGNKIAAALQAASPEATKELQDLYGQVEKISETGMDQLAATMNSGGKLATQELMTAYSQVAIDLKQSLSEVDTELNKSLAESNSAFSEALTEAQATRTEKMAAAMTDLQEALAAAKLRFDDTLAEATKDLQRSLLQAQKDYEKAIDEIEKSTQKKLDDLKLKLKEVATAMAALGASQASYSAMQNAPVFTPSVTARLQPGDKGFIGPVANTTHITNNVTGVNMTDPTSTAAVITNGIKYGTAVTVSASTMAAYGQKPTSSTSVSTQTGVKNKLKAMGFE
jgi:hypothetical protein